MRPGNFEARTEAFEITLPEEYWLRIERLCGEGRRYKSVESLVTGLLDHVQQGVYRSGSWEREWVEGVAGYEAVEEAYADDCDQL